ncbi:MAG: glycerate kinase [Actinomycetota bacterium]|nr:glycerate kinase [Actinomycetota bacterium]
MRIVVCPDKFRGTATAVEVVEVCAEVLGAAGHRVDSRPMADGGEGTLEALGGPNRSSLVTGPLGDPVDATWRLSGGTAVIEMARASGLLLAGGSGGNDPLAATTSGTGELIAEAVAAGAKRIIVGVGGSATTDGGLGAIRAMEPLARLRGVDLMVACDVRIPFVEAARVFGPQKGATAAQIELLERRLERLADVYDEQYGVDVRDRARAGAAGGLAGGLAAVGASLVEGFDLIADEVGLVDAIEDADLVITGEGAVDEESFDGKVVGGVVGLAGEFGVRVVVIAGQIDEEAPIPDGVQAISLSDRFGADRSMDQTLECVAEVVAELADG